MEKIIHIDRVIKRPGDILQCRFHFFKETINYFLSYPYDISELNGEYIVAIFKIKPKTK